MALDFVGSNQTPVASNAYGDNVFIYACKIQQMLFKRDTTLLEIKRGVDFAHPKLYV